MERAELFNKIELKLTWLLTRVKHRSSLNILDLNSHAEDFYADLFNLIFDWNLENLNKSHQNIAGIDLIDRNKRIIIQVTSTKTREKIEYTLSKDLSKFDGYSLKFIFIADDADELRKFKKPYTQTQNVNFTPLNDIYDMQSVLRIIKGFSIDKLKKIQVFVYKQLPFEPEIQNLDSHLATIITILSKVDWRSDNFKIETRPYDIEAKIEYNHLNIVRELINEKKIYCSRIEKIYSDFNLEGVNKSLAVLNGIKSTYIDIKIKNPIISQNELFRETVVQVINKISSSANYTPIPSDELEFLTEILIVDAFIRCKIFDNPIGGSNAYP